MCKQIVQFRQGRRPTVLKTKYKRLGDVIDLVGATVVLTKKKEAERASYELWQDIGLGLKINELAVVEKQLQHCVKVYLNNVRK